MEVANKSAWQEDAIVDYLASTVIPIRLAVARGDYPLLCSVWYRYDRTRDVLQCVSHESSYLLRTLRRNSRCSFEIAPNEPPYQGVRGSGNVTLTRSGAGDVLESLIVRYLGDTGSSLANWLLGRVDEEYVIEIEPVSVSAWDYTQRMQG